METCELFHRCAGRRPDRPHPETHPEPDPLAWEILVERHGRDVERGVRRALARSRRQARRELIEDLIQETWCRLLDDGGRRLLEFRGRGRRAGALWLEQVAHRLTVDLLRRRSAVKRGGRGGRRRWKLEEERDRCPHRLPAALARLALADWSRQVVEACRRNDPSGFEAVVVELTVRRGWSSPEVARWSARRPGRRLGVSGVDTLVSRCRRRLEGSGVPMPRRERPTGSRRRRRSDERDEVPARQSG